MRDEQRAVLTRIGVCPRCLHMLNDHTGLPGKCMRDSGVCDTCDSIMAEVFDRWRRGEGNPPDEI